MCTIMTLSQYSYQDARTDVIQRIQTDSYSNDDGWNLILTAGTEIVTNLKTLHLEPIFQALEYMPWDRMFLHARYATQGESNIFNCHGFESNGFLYMHNGTIRDKAAGLYPVDSLLIGDWLQVDIDYTINKLFDEKFQNTFLLDANTAQYYVTRSEHNTLYTNGIGDYSTNEIGDINRPVDNYSYSLYSFDDDLDAYCNEVYYQDDIA